MEAPYMVCPLHTQKAWEAYEAAQPPEVTNPTESNPTVTTTP